MNVLKKRIAKSTHPIYNLRFGMVCLGSLLFSTSFNMLIPELPAYLSSLGGAEYKGLIISLFTLTAGISRPFSGRLTDTIGRVPVMLIGAVVCLMSGFLYPVLGTVSGFLLLRLVHGFSTGFTPTALAAYVADIIPKGRWGEAMGLQGLFFSTGFAIGPAIGSFITLSYSFNILFYASSLFAFMGMLIFFQMKETLPNRQRFTLASLKISKRDIIAPEVLPAAIVMFLSYIGFGVILTLIPDWSGHLGTPNKGLFFIVFTIASLTIRFVAGRASDKYGRELIINIGLFALVLGLAGIGYATTLTHLLFAAAAYGLAMGILSPAINAWTIDLSHPDYRGKAMATMYIALEAGIGLGAFISGWYYQDDIFKMPVIMYASAFIGFMGLIYMIFRKRQT
ncbi:MFS transporter [Spongiimicrobium sp. 3-5]|uniref:MFS transporter n=1 Tax=Spongiimicrobium sp. 3-5 TaxID=3332596 RepID=UPI003980D0C6